MGRRSKRLDPGSLNRSRGVLAEILCQSNIQYKGLGRELSGCDLLFMAGIEVKKVGQDISCPYFGVNTKCPSASNFISF